MVKAPERLTTPRLVLRRPTAADAEAILARYAGDPEVTRYLSWPRHESLAETRAFLAFSDSEWLRWPAGPYLVESRARGGLLGSTGLGFESLESADTGYVFARDAWSRGYATESLHAMVEIARATGVVRLVAECHPENHASVRVLEKCGFDFEGLLPAHSRFPNLGSDELHDVLRYARTLR